MTSIGFSASESDPKRTSCGRRVKPKSIKTTHAFRRLTKRLAVTLTATIITATAAITFAPAASAVTVTSNCGILTCSIYADRQSTRTLDHYVNSPEAGLAIGAVQAAECEYLGLGGILCDAAALISSYDLGSALRTAVLNGACVEVKYPRSTPGSQLPIFWFTWSSNGSYCKDGSLPFTDGTLIKKSSQPYVYVVYGGAKFLVPNPTAFNQLGYSWSAIRTVSDRDFQGVPLIPAQGTILREYTLPTVYRIENGHKRAVTLSEYLANNYGYLLRYVPDGDLQQIPG